MALKLGIQTYQVLTNDDEVCIPSLSSILLAVNEAWSAVRLKFQVSGKHEIFEKT